MGFRKKHAFAAIAIAFCVLVSACSKTGSSSDSAPTATSVPATSNPSEKKASSDDPSIKRKIEFIKPFSGKLNDQFLADNPLKTKLEQELNIDLKANLVPGAYDAYMQKLNTLIASGSLPDLVYLNRSDLVRFVKQGVLLPIDEALAQVPDLQNSRTKEAWTLTNVANKTYGVSRVSQGGAANGSYIRQDWLDKLGLQIPKTTDDLLKVLTAFSANDPDGNGKADTYGYSAYGFGVNAQSMIGNAFGLPSLGITETGVPEDWIDAQGKLHFGPISPEYKQYLTYMKKLVDSKAIDPDIVTNTLQISQQKMIQGQVGFVSMPNPQNWMFGAATLQKQITAASPSAKWVYVEPVKGPTGLSGNGSGSLSAPFMYAVTKNAASEPGKVERILKLIDYLDSREQGKPGSEIIKYGIDGVDNERVNGKVIKVTRPDEVLQYTSTYELTGLFPSIDKLKISWNEADIAMYQKVLDHNSRGHTIANNYYSTLSFTYDGSKYVQEMALKFIYGREDLAAWDDYVKTLNERYKYQDVQEQRKLQLQEAGLIK
ncbi:extracellular solute-binding protein [Paenibacillus koleovorans]|uniref:extracellular solute-binding protein n=1 Tax=Paenibacillus koleovorans TaxID=121608 RepID=UPI000FD928E7|nr:extracellular solute-binding protein [Paenibacillus koleovorans]